MGDNYMTMSIDEFEELPFTFEGDLAGQADPMPFFKEAFSKFLGKDETALVIYQACDMRKAMIHVMEKLGAHVYDAEPTDSYNFMLDVIHYRDEEDISEIDYSSKRTSNIALIAGSTEALRGLLKHSAEISAEKILLIDRYAPQILIDDLKAAWGCDVFMFYTRPEFGGLGAITNVPSGGLVVCDELYIEIIDPETGLLLPDGKWGEIVVTSMFPAASPLVRYRTGDICRYIADDDLGQSSILHGVGKSIGAPRLDRVRNYHLRRSI